MPFKTMSEKLKRNTKLAQGIFIPFCCSANVTPNALFSVTHAQCTAAATPAQAIMSGSAGGVSL